MNCNEKYMNKIYQGDCVELLGELTENSVDLALSDIPYGISLDDWDVLHGNTNSALLGSSPAQSGKAGFKRRGKPINGWSQADRNIGVEYQNWCSSWSGELYRALRPGSFALIFGARRTIHHVINAFEANGFLLKDVLSWKKRNAHHRAQRVSPILEKRGMFDEAAEWEGWRLGNLAPIWEPIAWFMKPYKIGGTVTDNILQNRVGAMNIEAIKSCGFGATNQFEVGFEKGEGGLHDAQKPVKLMELLIQLTLKQGQVVCDPFMGSGTTAIAAMRQGVNFIGFESSPEIWKIANERLNGFEQGKSSMRRGRAEGMTRSLDLEL